MLRSLHVRRCPVCAIDAQHSLHCGVRRMNEHLKNIHQMQPMSSENFKSLPMVEASKTGSKGSYEVKRSEQQPDGFRSDSVFESRVQLLKSCVYFTGEEDSLTAGQGFFQGTHNPFSEEILNIFIQAKEKCNQAGSTLVRQHAVRNAQNGICEKVFLPIEHKSAQCYARTVAHFVYFCSKVQWNGRPKDDFSALSILKHVLFQKHVGITQTFITR